MEPELLLPWPQYWKERPYTGCGEVSTHYFLVSINLMKMEIKSRKVPWMEMAIFNMNKTKNDINPCTGSHAIISKVCNNKF